MSKRARICSLAPVLAFAVLASLAAAAPARAGQTATPAGLPLGQKELRRLLAQSVRDAGVPGMVARLATPDGFVAASFGRRQRGATPAFAVDDPVHIGSCLKAMTATVVGRLVDRGVVRWDTTLAEVFPELADALDPELGTITFEELLSHRSGLTDAIPDELLAAIVTFHGTGAAARERFLPQYLATQPQGVRGEYSYSNLGYALAGAMLERVTGMPFEELLRREVFVPLGMRSARFGAPGSNDPGVIDAPRGHAPDGRPLLPAQQSDPPVISPAGTFSMTLADWSRFAIAQLGLPVRGQLLLSAASLARLHTPVGGELPPPLAPARYALGWVVIPTGDSMLLTHDGSNDAWLSLVAIHPASGRILLLSTNQGGDRGSAALSGVLADPRVAAWLGGG